MSSTYNRSSLDLKKTLTATKENGLKLKKSRKKLENGLSIQRMLQSNTGSVVKWTPEQNAEIFRIITEVESKYGIGAGV